ncbi:hypothetical protein [Chondromyces crocatus]|uniref:Uncharacterized protein n=1 Tax=Chondromyces crocatus TaxID=52 RepID=A0A0K1E562_CHOCO|nr:hypothetical protein [Chondromyces crocatus]AKT35989.1 uncharacterized protein CMC5_001010 [Chondromyces crocatus]
MTPKALALALTAASLLAIGACSPPPKQAEVPDVQAESGVDMAPDEHAGAADPSATAPSDPEEMRTKCCEECKAGLAKDRTGAPPDTIPCADYTDTLSPWCLEHFRANPLMASKCQ